MSDHTVIPLSMFKYLKNEGHELTKDQEKLISSYLYGLQDLVMGFGLPQVVRKLSKNLENTEL